MSRPRKTAGVRLRERLEAARDEIAKEAGVELDWDQKETERLSLAVAVADRIERIAAQLEKDGFVVDAARPGEKKSHPLLVELRQSEAHLDRLLAKISLEPPVTQKSFRHQKAAAARWAR